MKKKILAVMLASMFALTAVACSSNSDSTKSSTGEATTEETTSKEATTGEAKADGDVYIIATDTTFAPFEFEDADGKYVGIDMDILDAIAKDQGFEYKVNPLGFSAALTALDAGQADGMIAGMSITDERKEKFDFSEAYYDADVTMAVAKDSEIKSYDDLSGKNVAIKTGTNGGDFAKSIMDQYGFTVSEFEDSSNMYQDVITGNSVACFEDYPVVAYAIQQGLALQVVDECMEAGSSYGFAVQKGQNAELLKMFNDGLKNIKDNGKFDEIVDKYTK